MSGNQPEGPGESTTDETASLITRWLTKASPAAFSAYCIFAAFTTYFCMYGFRKPFTAATYEGAELWGVGYKSVLVAAQVAGYTLSKFIGIKVISEMSARYRAITILGLIAIAELALVGFAVVPAPYNFPLLFVNGLPLGMVFGLVLAFLEGRQVTEALSAGLCASFIVSSGVVKSVGRTLIGDYGISDYWMPCLTGLLFVIPLMIGVYLLNQIPRPSAADVKLRAERPPMTSRERRDFLGRHRVGLFGLLLTFILLTVMRSLRDDFAVEIWLDMEGDTVDSKVFAKSETMIALCVTAVNGAAIWIASNRRALLSSFALIIGGFILVLAALTGYRLEMLSSFAFMVLVGLGMYVPYVAFHTTVFERLIAVFRERANIGYLMYLADATGYLAYVCLTIWSSRADNVDFLKLFTSSSWYLAILAIVVMIVVWAYYHVRLPRADHAIETVATTDA